MKIENECKKRHYWMVFAIVLAVCFAIQPVFAASSSDLWTNVKTLIKDIYAQILTISTAIAALVIVIALIIRMISRDQRAVDSSWMWVKRAALSWIIINCLAWLLSYGENIFGGRLNPGDLGI